ncbi:MAG: hypothetical protein NC240_10025 [Clostridium sp.]|nr:hypothetical protein [Clostridium sp.]
MMMFHRKLSNVGILNGLVDKFKIHIPLCGMACTSSRECHTSYNRTKFEY